jgi:hypothetical protein
MESTRPAARSTRARGLAAPEAHSAALSTKENSVGRGGVASASAAPGKAYQASPLHPHNAQPLIANAGDDAAKPESKPAAAKAAPEPEVPLSSFCHLQGKALRALMQAQESTAAAAAVKSLHEPLISCALRLSRTFGSLWPLFVYSLMNSHHLPLSLSASCARACGVGWHRTSALLGPYAAAFFKKYISFGRVPWVASFSLALVWVCVR